MHSLLAIIICLAVVSLAGAFPAAATPHGSPEAANAMTANATPTPELAAQFRAFRAAARDPSTTQSAELRAWAGPMHAVMAELGARLGSERPVSDVVTLLGEPDEILPAGHRRTGLVVPAGREYLVYWWRGRHDYLYFVAGRGRVHSSKWWYAGE